MARPTPIPERNWVNIQWLTRLRWAEVAGQAATVLVAHFLLEGLLPIAPLLTVIGIGLVSQLVIEMYFFGDRRRGVVKPRDVHEWQLALIMMIDIAILTGLLYLSGGPTNPFSFLYLVNIALAAVVLSPRWTWVLVGLSLACFGLLFLHHVPLPMGHEEHHHGGHSMLVHLQGMWVAFGVAAAFIVYFIQRVTRALAEQEEELAQSRARTAPSSRSPHWRTSTVKTDVDPFAPGSVMANVDLPSACHHR